MTLLEEFAQLLAQLGHGVYTNQVGDTIFLERLPPDPDEAVALARYGGAASDSKLPQDEIRLQARVRGSMTDTRSGEQRAQAIYDDLHGLSNRALPGGTWLELCVGVQGGPVYMGPDEHDRNEYAVSFRASLHRQTANRP